MKLQYKISIRFLIITVIVFTVAGVLFYVMLGMVVHQNMDEMLSSRKEGIISYLQTHTMSDSTYRSPDNGFVIHSYQGPDYSKYTDTLIYEANDKEIVPCRKLSFTANANGRTYKIDIIQSLLETEDLIEVILYFMLGLFVLVVIILLTLNYRLSFSIWKPFFATLHQLKSFKIGKTQNLQFPGTGTYEFDVLNETLNELTQKLQADFTTMKEFTENASHEIQTPLAVIKSKLETTLHDPTLPENHRKSVHAAYESAIRLSKLNEALLLLAKIENHQFTDERNIDLTIIIEDRLHLAEELFNLKNIQITVNITEPFRVNMSPYLAEILMSNLIGNALKHNIANGKISINGNRHLLSVSNTGDHLNIDPANLFKRFLKQSANSESTGLGLAIASEICSLYHLNLDYKYQNGVHTLSLSRDF